MDYFFSWDYSAWFRYSGTLCGSIPLNLRRVRLLALLLEVLLGWIAREFLLQLVKVSYEGESIELLMASSEN